MRRDVCRHNGGGGAALAAGAAALIIVAATKVKPSGSTSYPVVPARPAPVPVHTVIRTITRTVTVHAHLLSGTDIVAIAAIAAFVILVLGCAYLARHLRP